MMTLLASWFAVSSVQAATYYVRKDGSDSSAGTLNSAGGAWLTVQKAANTAAAGDTVLIQPGTYAEQVTLARNGTAGAKISFQGSSGVTLGGLIVSGDYLVVRDLNLNMAGVGVNEGTIHIEAGASSCVFSNITITGWPGIDSGPGGVIMAGNANTTVSNYIDSIHIVNPKYHAFGLTGLGHTVTNCTVTGTTGWDCFRIVGSNLRIVGNRVTNFSNPGEANPNHCDIFQSFGDNSDVSRNVLIEGNFVRGCEGYQLGNVTDDQENGDISGWTFRNNVFADISNTLNLFAPNFTFVNNTFYRCGIASGFVVIYASSGAGHANNLTLMNNIFAECGDPVRATRGWYGGDPVTGLVADYNLVVGTGAGTVKTGFQTAGLETHSINGLSPQFVNPAANDFRLQSTSPCIGVAAVLNSQFTTDSAGTLRGSSWDMGAFEAGGGGSAGTPAIAVIPSSLSFTPIPVGTTATRTLTVQNVGSGTLTGSASVSAPFSIVSGGSYSLASGLSQLVTVQFSPTTAATNSVIANFTGGGGASATVTGGAYAAGGGGGTSTYVLCEGDSLTAGTGAWPQAYSNYVAQLASWYPGSKFENIGVGGDKISANTTAADTLDNLAAASGYGKRTVVFLMGINDIAVNDSVATVTTNVSRWIAAVRAADPGVFIVGLTSYELSSFSLTFNSRVAAMNVWTRTMADFDAVVDIAADPRFVDLGNYFDPDGVHLNNAGYSAMAELVEASLVNNGRLSTTDVPPATVAAPVFAPGSQTFTSSLQWSASSATPGASIFYTMDGSTPTTGSAVYGGPVTITASTTVRAIAVKSGMLNSSVASVGYTASVPTATVATPVFTPGSTTFTNSLQWSISTATAGASIFYTLNGSTPTTSSTPYTGPVTVSASTTVRAIAAKSGMLNSAVASATYTAATAGGSVGRLLYVRKDGNDNNSGTANSAAGAWLTVRKAALTAVAGDTVLIQPGTYAERVTLANSGTAGAGITFQGATGVTLGGIQVSGDYVAVRDLNLNMTGVGVNEGTIHILAGASSCVFSNITITGSTGIDSGPGGVIMAGNANTTLNNYIDRIRIVNPKYHAFGLSGLGHTVTNCTVTGTTGWDCFRIVGSNLRIVGNTITNFSNPGEANPNHCDIFQSFGDNSDVSKNVLIEGNFVRGCEGYQLGNVTDDQENGDISGWTFRNNVFADIPNTLNLFAPNFTFINNTFYRCGTASGFVVIYASTGAGHANNLTLLNNIFAECGDPARATRGWYGGDPVTGLVADYNLVVGTGAGTVKTGFQTAGLETHGINGLSPLFVNPAANDFRLQRGSPSIGTATVLNNLFTTDWVGSIRGTTWDMGAVEAINRPAGLIVIQ